MHRQYRLHPVCSTELMAYGLNRWLRPVEALERQAIGPADEHE